MILPTLPQLHKIGKNHKKKQKNNYGYSNILNILHIQRKCLSMVIIDRHFEETPRYLKIKIFYS